MSPAPVSTSDHNDDDSSTSPMSASGEGSITNSVATPLVCVVRFASDAASGGLLGAAIGYGSGLFKKKGFKGAFSKVGHSAKTFAVLSGVNSLVLCILKRLRGKDDVINAGVAGCCTGLALSIPGAPTTLLQSCLTFGAFSVIIEGLNKQKPAMAHQISYQSKPVDITLVSSLACPLPKELQDERGGIAAIATCDDILLGVSAYSISTCSSVMESEIRSILCGLKLAKDLNMEEVIIASDSSDAIWAIHKGSSSISELAEVLVQCLTIILSKPKWSVIHVLRESNYVADYLAKYARCEQWSWNNLSAIPRPTADVWRSSLSQTRCTMF